MEALVGLLSIRGLGPEATRPESIKMTLGLYALWQDVSVEGMWKYLEEGGTGKNIDATVTWCRLIGAEHTARYLQAINALFPDRQVLADDEARRRFVDQLGRRGTKDPLAELDREYKGAVDDVPDRLRAYLKGHLKEVEAWLAGSRA
jgi:hypothetical protein